jgi:hypothetical protein
VRSAYFSLGSNRNGIGGKNLILRKSECLEIENVVPVRGMIEEGTDRTDGEAITEQLVMRILIVLVR